MYTRAVAIILSLLLFHGLTILACGDRRQFILFSYFENHLAWSRLPPTTSMSTAYVATAQAWAASGQTNRQHQKRRSPEPKLVSSWRPPVTLFVKMEFGMSFGGGSPTKPHKVTLNYPTSPWRRARFLQTGDHTARRAASEENRRNKHRTTPIPKAIAPLNAISLSRKPVAQPQSSIHPHESASQVPTERPRPRRSSSLEKGLPGSGISFGGPINPPHPERTIKPRPPPPQRKLSRQEIARKPLPETPARFRLGEAGMPWDSPHIPATPTNTISPGQQHVMPHSARALTSPSDWHEQYVAQYQYRSASNPTTPVSPLVSHQSSHASACQGTGHSRMNSWGIASYEAIGPRPTPSSYKNTIKAAVNPPPLQAAPPNMPLPPVPRSPKSHLTREPVIETPVLEYAAGHEETEDEAIQRELQEAKDAKRRTIDPQRARELGELNAAMIGFEALDDKFYEPARTWDAQSDITGMPKASHSLGWAVRIEPEQTDAERRAARRRAKGKQPAKGEREANRQRSRSRRTNDSRPPSSGSEGASQRTVAYAYSPEDVGKGDSVWQEYSPEDWEQGIEESSVWRGIERRRSWTSGEALEWQGQYWSAATYR